MSLEIFCCYAHEDKDLLKQLQSHLMPLQRQEMITVWADLEIKAGTEWESEIKAHLEKANIILLLISPAFMASDYCYSKEMMRALERQKIGKTRVVPIILRPVYWEGVLGQLQALPENGKPVTLWPNQDEAFLNIAEGIYKLAKMLLKKDTNFSYMPTQHLPITDRNSKRNSKISRKIVSVLIAMVFIILAIPVMWIYAKNFSSTMHWQDYKNATQTAAPTIQDPLKDNSQSNGWTEKTTESDKTFFQGNAYIIRSYQQGNYAYGCESKLDVDNVAFQVSMIILPSGNYGNAGVVLGYQSNLQYTFTIDSDQNYEVDRISSIFSGLTSTSLIKNKSSLIHKGYNTNNLLEVLKKTGSIELFVNNTYLTTVPITDTSGYIGFVVKDNNGPSAAMFQDFKLWTIA